MIPSLRTKPYEVQLDRLNLFTFEKRRPRGDMIQVFKYLNKFSNVNHSKLFKLQTNSRTRNSGEAFQAKRCNTDTDRSYFSNRVFRHRSSLPAEVVNGESINSIKKRIDPHFGTSGVNSVCNGVYINALILPASHSCG